MSLFVTILLIALFGFGGGGVLLAWALGAFESPHDEGDDYIDWEHIDD